MGCENIYLTNRTFEKAEKIKEIMCIAPRLGIKIASLFEKRLVCGARLFAAWEQEPNISNEIKLTKYDQYESFMDCEIEKSLLKLSFENNENAICIDTKTERKLDE